MQVAIQNGFLAALVPQEMCNKCMHMLFETASSPHYPHTGAAEAAIPSHPIRLCPALRDLWIYAGT